MLTTPAVFVIAFTWLLHAALLGAVLCQIVLLFVVITRFDRSTPETIMRSASAVAGLLLFITSLAMNLSIPALMLSVITQGGALMTGLFGAILPAAVGFLVAAYANRYFSNRDTRRNRVGMRILSLVLSLALFLYIEAYTVAFSVEHTAESLRLLAPSMSYTLAVLVFAILRYHPPEETTLQAAE
jgi:hypothetical protein